MGFPFAVSTVCLLSLTCAVMCSETYTISIHDRTIHCVKCPAGMYLVSNCSLDYGNAICESCGSGTYQPHPTTATSCALCRTECPYNTPQRTVQLVNGKCTMTSDIECLCVEGFYDDGGACRKWAECQPGEGVVTKGNPVINVHRTKVFIFFSFTLVKEFPFKSSTEVRLQYCGDNLESLKI